MYYIPVYHGEITQEEQTLQLGKKLANKENSLLQEIFFLTDFRSISYIRLGSIINTTYTCVYSTAL